MVTLNVCFVLTTIVGSLDKKGGNTEEYSAFLPFFGA